MKTHRQLSGHSGPPVKVPTSKKSMTVPGLEINPAQALKMYASGTLQRNMTLFYQQEDMPDLNRMSLLERLELQAQYREDLLKAKAELQSIEESNALKLKTIKEQEHEQKLRDQITNELKQKNDGQSK